MINLFIVWFGKFNFKLGNGLVIVLVNREKEERDDYKFGDCLFFFIVGAFIRR